jgi:hypothetical protein
MNARTPRLVMVTCAAMVAGAACDGQKALSGIGEPFQVVGGQFIEGDLPGTPPQMISAEAGIPTGPRITNISFNSQLVSTGAAGKSVSGRATGASSVGARFPDMGTGYWIVPIAEPDSQFPGENAFRFSANFDPGDPPGLHNLRFVAIDAQGRGGVQSEVSLCIAGRIPDNLHSCIPDAPPPAAVITLQWDTNFDLDLHVVTPSGVDINPKAPLAQPPDGGVIDPGLLASFAHGKLARIDRDSLGACIPDGLRQEDLVFPDPPLGGLYTIYVDPFAACGQSAARFEVSIYQISGVCPACALKRTFTQAGELLASEMSAGASTGLRIATYSF